MSALRTGAHRSMALQGTRRRAEASGNAGALHGDLERQALQLRSMLAASRPAAAAPARASRAATATAHGKVGEGPRVEELLLMRRLLAEKLEERHTPSEPESSGPRMRASKMAERSVSSSEEVSGWSRRSTASQSMSLSPPESPMPVARVLVKDGLAYVVR
ncbi:unnamed protein product [Prorocentrum cordatum]|uniref:Uncharacterized protein n=1 Tax=Prorocentrum cordatum TaxID=2364126 RepID=A0ABN9UVS7_9DINO|nr:unnamed protein product [Polarella glacialis]